MKCVVINPNDRARNSVSGIYTDKFKAAEALSKINLNIIDKDKIKNWFIENETDLISSCGVELTNGIVIIHLEER